MTCVVNFVFCPLTAPRSFGPKIGSVDAIVTATAIPAASTPSFPSITSIAESLEFDTESLGLLALLSALRSGV